ncbi:MAG TPA: phosphoribosylamine--glycine ligase [Gemmatimonadaceae bacterium]|nr:phosphoribosylamine--glycine ligase [Gemmatimonadaceae bacterium]
MKVLLVGSGGREHAIAWKLKQDDPDLTLVAAPGNPGIAELGACHPIAATDVEGLASLAAREDADLTVVGPEAPLAAGIVDAFRERGLTIFGPTAVAARIESSKRFAKELMLEARVPTGDATWHRDANAARRAARLLGAPVVIKASGLAAGKGVAVCATIEDADRAIDAMLHQRVHGAAGEEILVEEFLEGEELSLFALTDGTNYRVMLPAQDHKRLLDGDRGPNTGGMGAYAPVSIGTADVIQRTAAEIIEPVLAALSQHGAAFTGLLYCGLILTPSGPKVIEFNSRFGDPETQVVLPLLGSRLLELLAACASEGGLKGADELVFRPACAVTTVVAAPGYPDSPGVGAPIDLPGPSDDLLIFHAGTKRDGGGRLVTAGGRVVAVTAVADDFDEARERSRAGAEQVRFTGAQFRTDIGWREAARRAGAA